MRKSKMYRIDYDAIKDIMTLCEIKSPRALADAAHIDPYTASGVYYGRRLVVIERTLLKICDAIGSLPEEIAAPEEAAEIISDRQNLTNPGIT